MFRLTREVRFAINNSPDDQLRQGQPSNSYAGFPSLVGFGRFFCLQVTIQGQLDPSTCYLRNIKDIDQAVRDRLAAAPDITLWPSGIFELLRSAMAPDVLHSIALRLSPFVSLTQLASEPAMTRLSQKFEFSASHRLHNPTLSDEENRRIYGKCNNPSGHGHNYELQVTLRGKPHDNGLLADIPAFEKIVHDQVIGLFDHKNLNVDVPQFKSLIPTVENISMVIYHLLKNRFAGIGAELAAVTVWETPKTWCEYSE